MQSRVRQTGQHQNEDEQYKARQPPATDDRLKMDKSAFSVASLHDEPDEVAYWRSKTPSERLEAVELMRQVVYGYTPASAARLQRVLELAELTPWKTK